jgi:hypothetical protein
VAWQILKIIWVAWQILKIIWVAWQLFAVKINLGGMRVTIDY